MGFRDFKVGDFRVGDHVKLHPASDWFMRGVVWVTVVKIGRKLLTVRSELFGKTFTIHPSNINEKE